MPVVDAYNAGDAGACITAIEAMESQIGRDKFTALFRDLYETRLTGSNGGGFDPLIVLTEK